MQIIRLRNGVEMPQIGYGVYQVSPEEYRTGVISPQGGLPDQTAGNAPDFLKQYVAYYKSKERGYHPRSLNSNMGWNITTQLDLSSRADIQTVIAQALQLGNLTPEEDRLLATTPTESLLSLPMEMICGKGVYEKGEIRDTPYMRQAYEIGKSIKLNMYEF